MVKKKRKKKKEKGQLHSMATHFVVPDEIRLRMILIEPKGQQQQQRRQLKLQFLTWTRSLDRDVNMRKKIVIRTE